MEGLDQARLTDLVSEVLESARIEAVRRMSARGHPLTLTRHVLSIAIDPQAAGWKSDVITEQIGGLYSGEIPFDIGDRSVPNRILGLKDQLLPLADYLARNSNLATGRYSGLMGDDEIDGLLFRCISPMAVHYLTSLTDLASGEAERAARLATELYDMATEDSVTHLRHIVVSGGWSQPVEAIELRLSPGLSARRSSANTSAGVLNPSIARGRSFISSATA